MMKYPRRGIALGMAALLAIGLVACGSDKSDKLTAVVTVKADKAGTYSLGYVTVTAPAGAVKKDTQLKMTPTRSTNAPFGAASTQFDLSSNGGVEPAKPLDVSVKLPSKLPTDVVPEHVLLYSASADGKGWSLVPGLVKDGRLHAQLTHLSPKIMVYPTDQQLLDAAGIKPSGAASTQNCPTSVSIKAGKVLFTDASKGWDNKKGSPIDACLAANGEAAKLTVTNNVDFALDVASTNGLKLATEVPSIEEHAIEQIARKAFPDSRIKAYLHSGSSFSTSLSPANLPATVELRANIDTFLSQAAWNSLKFIISVASAKSDDELIKLTKKVLDTADILDCVTSSLKLVTGKQPSLMDVFNAITGPCAGKIMDTARDILLPSGNIWDAFFGRLVAVPIEGATIGGQTLWGAFTGIKMQFVGAGGTMRIAVALVRPEIRPTPTVARKLPESCGVVEYHAWVTNKLGHAKVTVVQGSVGCGEATRIVQQFFGSEIGSSGGNGVGIWNCGFAHAPSGYCNSSRGRFDFVDLG